MTGEPWWRGTRGEWLVAGQLVLMALVFFGPRTLAEGSVGALPSSRAGAVLGAVLIVAGALLLVSGAVALGPNLTPLPRPRDRSTLVRTGPYRFVRHPMYGGGILLAFGWAILVHSGLTLAYAAALLVFLDVKSRREEEWLRERFPDYEQYRRKVRKLVPFLY